MLLNVPLGQGADFRGVASTLKPPADAAGALIDPAEIGESLLESIIEVDEAVMERYFEGTPPSEEESRPADRPGRGPGHADSHGLRFGQDAAPVCPSCSRPWPSAPCRRRRAADGQERAPARRCRVKADPAGPLVAQVFKTRIDPFVQKLNFIRVFSGTLKKDSIIPVVGVRKGVKLAQLLDVQASETEPVEEAGPGGIVAVAKVEDLHTGTTLGELTLPPIPFPTPMVGLAASPKSRGDEGKLSGACRRSARKTRRSTAISTPRPRKWSSPA